MERFHFKPSPLLSHYQQRRILPWILFCRHNGMMSGKNGSENLTSKCETPAFRFPSASCTHTPTTFHHDPFGFCVALRKELFFWAGKYSRCKHDIENWWCLLGVSTSAVLCCLHCEQIQRRNSSSGPSCVLGWLKSFQFYYNLNKKTFTKFLSRWISVFKSKWFGKGTLASGLNFLALASVRLSITMGNSDRFCK